MPNTKTEWHNITTRNKLAELCERYLKKGDKVFVEGRIKTRKWDDNGQTRYTTEIVANSIEFLTPKTDSDTKMSNQPFFCCFYLMEVSLKIILAIIIILQTSILFHDFAEFNSLYYLIKR